MSTNRDNLTAEQKTWIDTIESDPELFLALAEESGLADKIRKRLDDHRNGVEPEPAKEIKHQRDLLARSIGEAALKAGLVEPGMDLSGPQLLLLLNDMGLAAKATVDRNELMEQWDDPNVVPVDEHSALEAIRNLDKTYYKRWKQDTDNGDTQQGFVSGNIKASDLSLVIEYTRQQFAKNGGMNPSSSQPETLDLGDDSESTSPSAPR